MKNFKFVVVGIFLLISAAAFAMDGRIAKLTFSEFVAEPAIQNAVATCLAMDPHTSTSASYHCAATFGQELWGWQLYQGHMVKAARGDLSVTATWLANPNLCPVNLYESGSIIARYAPKSHACGIDWSEDAPK